MTRLTLAADELAIVRAILAACLPDGVTAFAFGSRAGGRPKPWSDLDLVLEGPQPLSLDLMAELAERFSESSLPWKVDLVDRAAIDEEFGRIVDRAKVPLA